METQLIFPAYTFHCRKPVNFREEDDHLFKVSHTTPIEETIRFSLKNASVLRNTFFHNGKFYFAHSHVQPVSRKARFKKLKLFIKPFRKIEKGLWIINEWSFEYFHWLADALPRLLAAGDYQQYGPVLLPEYYATRPYVVESLQRLNVPVLFFNPRKRLLVKELTVVSPTASTGNFNEPAILPVRERLMVHGKQAVRKIYISRQKAAKRRITNEEEVIAIFREAGFEIHYFEDYPFTRQLEIMGETRVLAGLHGAGLTNMLFMPPGGSILELRNAGDTHSNSFYSQAAAMRHSYYYLLCQGSSADTHNTDFLVDTAQLKAVLADMNNAEIKSL